MATYTKETALYDTGAIATDIANAGTTATSYITRVDATNGIRVHDLNESTDFVQVNSSAISMYRGGTAAANEKVRIEDDEIRVGATTTGHAILDEDGMDVCIGDTSVAHYGDYARVGKEGEANTRISPGEVVISASDDIAALRITPDGNTQTITKSISINKRIDAGNSFTQTHPAAPASGTVLKYQIYDYTGEQRRSFSITKGTSKSETSVNVSNQFKFKYSATTTKTTITNTGTARIRLESISYTYTTISPLTEVGGVLTLGQYPDIGSSTVLAVGNGTESAHNNLFEISSSAYPVSIGGSPMEDFVVEWNVDGMWTYRKWSSGIAECWGATGSNTHSMTQASGYGYWCSETYALPSGLFTSVNNVQANRGAGNGLVFISVYSVTVSQISCYVSCTSSGTISFPIYFSLKGRWK